MDAKELSHANEVAIAKTYDLDESTVRDLWREFAALAASDAAQAPMQLWQTGAPPTKNGDYDEYIVAVRRKAVPGRVFVFASNYANNYGKETLNDDEGNEYIADGWYTIGHDSSGEYDSLFMPMIEDGDEVIGWQALPKWSDAAPVAPTPTVAADAAAPSEACAHDYVRTDGVCTECGGSTKIANCPSKHCPQAAQPDERAAFVKAVQSLVFLCRTETKRLDDETLAALDKVEAHLVAIGASVRDSEGELRNVTDLEGSCFAPACGKWDGLQECTCARATTQQANKGDERAAFNEWKKDWWFADGGVSENEICSYADAEAAAESAFNAGASLARSAAPQAVTLSDAQIIERCKAAGIKWVPPELPDDVDYEMGFPGLFDMVSMDEMRALLAARKGDSQ